MEKNMLMKIAISFGCLLLAMPAMAQNGRQEPQRSSGHMQEQAKALDLITKWQDAERAMKNYRDVCLDSGCKLMIDQAIKKDATRVCGSFPQGDRACKGT